MAAADERSPTPPRYERYRAPREDNRALIVPRYEELADLAEANRRAVQQHAFDAGGWRLNAWSAATRRRLVDLATGYTRAFCDMRDVDPNKLIVSGHQPDLFHPGVWYKNRVLDRLAESIGGGGIHLLIDSDQRQSASLRVPCGPVDDPRTETILFDATTDPRPHEERSVVDAEQFASFADRVVAAMRGLVDQPLVADLWPEVQAAVAAGANLGEALSRGRRLIEQRWGANTLELPLSRLCDTRELQWGMAMVIADAPRVREAYNAALADYRDAHRLRSPAQPLPDLAMDGGAIETPLWVWTADNPTRKPLFIEPTANGWRLLDRQGGEWTVAVNSDRSLNDVADQIAALRTQGVKLRPRALLTTLLARLLLGDLFLHGIGGAKYDQVTDDWSRRWLGFTPPPHATVTATLRLPIAHPAASESMKTRLQVRLRELEFHPERFLSGDHRDAQPFVEDKRAAIKRNDFNRNARHRAIVAANESLQRFVRARRAETFAELDLVRHRLRAAAVLDSREYSLCLYPEADLRERFDRLLK